MSAESLLRVTVMIVLLRLIMFNTFMAFKRDIRVFNSSNVRIVPSLSKFFFYQDVDFKKNLEIIENVFFLPCCGLDAVCSC